MVQGCLLYQAGVAKVRVWEELVGDAPAMVLCRTQFLRGPPLGCLIANGRQVDSSEKEGFLFAQKAEVSLGLAWGKSGVPSACLLLGICPSKWWWAWSGSRAGHILG